MAAARWGGPAGPAGPEGARGRRAAATGHVIMRRVLRSRRAPGQNRDRDLAGARAKPAAAGGPLLRQSPPAGRAPAACRQLGRGSVPTRSGRAMAPRHWQASLTLTLESAARRRASESGVSLVLLRLNDPLTRSPAGGSAAAAVAPVAAAAAWRAGQGRGNSVVTFTECIISHHHQ